MKKQELNVQPSADRRGAKPLARDLRRIIVWTEVLDKPLARRGPRRK